MGVYLCEAGFHFYLFIVEERKKRHSVDLEASFDFYEETLILISSLKRAFVQKIKREHEKWEKWGVRKFAGEYC